MSDDSREPLPDPMPDPMPLCERCKMRPAMGMIEPALGTTEADLAAHADQYEVFCYRYVCQNCLEEMVGPVETAEDLIETVIEHDERWQNQQQEKRAEKMIRDAFGDTDP